MKTPEKNVESKRSMTGSNVEEKIGTHRWKEWVKTEFLRKFERISQQEREAEVDLKKAGITSWINRP